tara:strand:+ start:561 stop:800 length:240 start_codon:yes stop_codon:yes gene_type:complete
VPFLKLNTHFNFPGFWWRSVYLITIVEIQEISLQASFPPGLENVPPPPVQEDKNPAELEEDSVLPFFAFGNCFEDIPYK